MRWRKTANYTRHGALNSFSFRNSSKRQVYILRFVSNSPSFFGGFNWMYFIIIVMRFTLYTQLIENSLERKIIEWNQFPCSCYLSYTQNRCTEALTRQQLCTSYTRTHFGVCTVCVQAAGTLLIALCYIVSWVECFHWVAATTSFRRRHSTTQYFIYWFDEYNFHSCNLHLFVLRALSAPSLSPLLFITFSFLGNFIGFFGRVHRCILLLFLLFVHTDSDIVSRSTFASNRLNYLESKMHASINWKFY